MAPESQPTELLFDILYADRERLTLYLSQMDPNGILTGFKTSSTDVSAITSTVKAGVGVASVGYDGKSSNQDFLERSYDPASALPAQVLNLLDEKGYINREIRSTPIGSLLLCSGSLSLLDISYIQTLWPIFEKKLDLKSIATKINQDVPTGKAINANDISDIIKNLLQKIPQPIHMVLSNTDTIWATLRDEAFISSPGELFLKHKNTIPGEWYVLGILDCLNQPSDLDLGQLHNVGSVILDGLKQLFGSIVDILGRPNNAYGITPLIIFRKVNRCSNDT